MYKTKKKKKKIIVHFINKKHTKKTLISSKMLGTTRHAIVTI